MWKGALCYHVYLWLLTFQRLYFLLFSPTVSVVGSWVLGPGTWGPGVPSPGFRVLGSRLASPGSWAGVLGFESWVLILDYAINNHRTDWKTPVLSFFLIQNIAKFLRVSMKGCFVLSPLIVTSYFSAFYFEVQYKSSKSQGLSCGVLSSGSWDLGSWGPKSWVSGPGFPAHQSWVLG